MKWGNLTVEFGEGLGDIGTGKWMNVHYEVG